MTVRVLVGDALSVLKTLPDASIQLCVTSPPYFGLRSYSTDPQIWGGDPECGHTFMPSGSCPYCGAWRGELGSEPTPSLFIEHLVSIFDEVWRVLRKDGLVFCNLGDSYAGSGKGPQGLSGMGNQDIRMAGVIDPKGDKSKTTYPGEWELRADLTDEEVAYVLRELAACKSL
jgi:hypothetical protein